MENVNINPEENKYISLTEASALSGVSRDYLNVLIHRGKLQAIKSGKNWLTTEAWLAAYHAPQEDKTSASADKYLSLFSASQVAGVTPGYLNVAVRRGKLHAIKLGRNWFTTKDWVEDYQRSVGRLGSASEIVLEKIKAQEGRELKGLARELRPEVPKFKSLSVSRLHQDYGGQARFQDFDISKFEVGVKSRVLTAYERANVLERTEQKKFKSLNVSEFKGFKPQTFQSDLIKAARREAHKFFFSRAKLVLSSALVILFAFVSIGMASGLITSLSFTKVIDGILRAPLADRVFRNFDALTFQNLNISRYQDSKNLSAAASVSDIIGVPFRTAATFFGDMPEFLTWVGDGASDGVDRALAFFRIKSSQELAIGPLPQGEPQLKKPEEITVKIPQAESLTPEELFGGALGAESGTPIAVGGTPAIEGGIAIGSDVSALQDKIASVEVSLKDQIDLLKSDLTFQRKTVLEFFSIFKTIADFIPRHPGSTVITTYQAPTSFSPTVQPIIASGFDRLSANYFNLSNDATIKGNLTVSGGGTFTGSLSATGGISTGGTLTVTGATTLGDLTVNGTFAMGGTGTTTFAGPIASASGNFIIAGASANAVLINPFSGNVGIGTTSAPVTLTLGGPIVVGSVTSDPATGMGGEIVYRSDTNQFRGFSGGAWSQFGSGSSSGLQGAYNSATSSPEIVLNSTVGAFTIQDAATSSLLATNLFEIKNGSSSLLFAVAATSTNILTPTTLVNATATNGFAVSGSSLTVGSSNFTVNTAGQASSTKITTQNLTVYGINGSTQCLQVDSNGVVSGVGSTCGGSGTTFSLQNAYNASTSTPEIVLNSAVGAFTIQDAATTSNLYTNLFEIKNSSSSLLFAVAATSTNILTPTSLQNATATNGFAVSGSSFNVGGQNFMVTTAGAASSTSLTVSGASALNTLTTQGVATINGLLTGNNGLTIVGATSLQNATATNGFAVSGSSFNVGGQNFMVTTAGAASTTQLTVSGASALNTLTTQGVATINGLLTGNSGLTIVGGTSLQNATATNGFAVSGSSLTAGGQNFVVQTSGAASSTSLTVSGASELRSTLLLGGLATLQNGLTVIGPTSLQNATATNGFAVSGSSFNVGGQNFMVTTAGAASSTALTVSGAAELRSTLLLGGLATLQNGLTVIGPTSLQNATATNGFAVSGSSFTVGGDNFRVNTAGAASSTSVTTQNLTVYGINGSTQCLRASADGVVSGTGSDCAVSTTYSLQNAYNASTSTPDIILNSTVGAFTIQDAATSSLIATNLFEIRNGSSSLLFAVSATSTILSTGIVNYPFAVTTTIAQLVNSYAIATSTTASPLFSINGSNGKFGFGAIYSNSNSTAKIEIQDENGSNSDVQIRVAGGSYGELDFASSQGTLATPTISVSGNKVGSISFNGNLGGGNGYNAAAAIQAFVDATPSASSMPGRLVFYTTPAGDTTLAERMRITNAGYLGIGTTTPDAMLSVWGNGKFFGTLSASSTAYLTGLSVTGATSLQNATATNGFAVSGSSLTVGGDNFRVNTAGAASSTSLTTQNLTVYGINGSTQCLRASAAGVVSGTGSDCAVSTTYSLQNAYNASTSTPDIILNSTVGAFTIQDAATTSNLYTNLFEIKNSSSSLLFAVAATSTNILTPTTLQNATATNGFAVSGSSFNVGGQNFMVTTAGAASTTQLTVSGATSLNTLTTQGVATVNGLLTGNSGLTIVGATSLQNATATNGFAVSGSSLTVGGDNFRVNTAGQASSTKLTTKDLTVYGINGSTQCLRASADGVVSGTGSDCGAGGTTSLQNAYNAATSTPEIILNSAVGAFTIQDAATTSNLYTNLFEIKNSSSSLLFAVAATSTNILTPTTLVNATATNGFAVSGSSFNVGGQNFMVTTAGAASTTQLTVSGATNFGGAATFQSTITQQGTGIVSFGGNVGIGTTTPNNSLSIFNATTPALGFTTNSGNTGWTMGIDTNDANKFKIASSTTVGTNARFVIDASGNVGIASSSPSAVLSVNVSNATGLTPALNINSATTSLFFVRSDGFVGIGTTTQSIFTTIYATTTPIFSVSGNVLISNGGLNITATTSTTTIAGGFDLGSGIFTYAPSSAMTSISNLTVGSQIFDTDSGEVTWIDMPVTTGAATGTVESFTAQIDGTPILTIYSESNGVGGVNHTGVGIGTTLPQERLTLSSISNFATEMSSPIGVTTSTTTGGTLVAGTYYFKVTALDGTGTTTLGSSTVGSSEVSVAVATGDQITVSWSPVVGAFSYRVYGNSTGAQNHYFVTTSTSYAYATSTGSITGNVPSVTTAYINKIASSSASWLSGGNFGVGTSTPTATLFVRGIGATTPFTVASSSGSVFMTVLPDGNVGIGTSTPGSLLSVHSTGNVYFGGALTVSGPTSLQNATATNGFAVSGSSFNVGGQNFMVTTAGAASTTQLTVSGATNFGGAATFQSTITQQGTGIVSFGGNVGIGTTTPNNSLSIFNATTPALGFTTNSGNTGWTMGIDTNDANKFKIASSTTVGTNARFVIDASGNVGIASSSPSAVLSVNVSNATGNTPALNINSATTSLFFVRSDGFVGIGTTTQSIFTTIYATTTPIFSVNGNVLISNGGLNITATTSTTTIAGGFDVGSGMLSFSYDSGVTNIGNLTLGATTFDTDAGILSWVDMPVTTGAATGTIESYTAQIDGTSILTVYSESDGMGGLTRSAVGVGTTTPIATLSVGGTIQQTQPLFDVASSSAASFFRVTNLGNVGIGTTTGLFAKSTIAGSGSDSTTAALSVINNASTSLLFVRNDGNVGIGTTSPGSLLSVHSTGNVYFGGALTVSGATDIVGALTLHNDGNQIRLGDATTANGLINYSPTTKLFKISPQDTGSSIQLQTQTDADAVNTALIINKNQQIGLGTTSATFADLVPITGTGLVNKGYAWFYAAPSQDDTQQFQFRNSAGTPIFNIDAVNNRVGVGSTTPQAVLSVNVSNATGLASALNINSATSSLLFVRSDGFVGIGTTSQSILTTLYTTISPKFSVNGDVFISNGGLTITATTSTSTITGGFDLGSGVLTYEPSSAMTSISNLTVGSQTFDTDSGEVTWVDMPVTTGAATGTVQSFTVRIGGTQILTAYSESNGVGGVNHTAVGIDTKTPQEKLTLSSISNFATEMSAPTYATTTPAAGGTLVAGTYYFKVTALDGTGTTTIGSSTVGSSEVSAVAATGDQITISWSPVVGAFSYRVYGNSTGAQNHYFVTSATSYVYATSTGSITGNVPVVTTAYVNKIASSSASWLSGGNFGVGTSTPTATLFVRGTGATTPFSVASSSGSILFTIRPDGNVGVGTSTPGEMLSVAGNIVASGCISAYSAGGTTNGTCVDIAESYYSGEDLTPADIVAVKTDPASPEGFSVVKADSSMPVLGVVSTRPAIFMQGDSALFGGSNFTASSTFPLGSSAPLALAGRVPVKISLENGPIAIGDRISASSIAGVGKKASSTEATIGVALENFQISNSNFQINSNVQNSNDQNINKILVFVNLGQPALAAKGGTIDLATITSDLNLDGHSLLNVKSIAGMSGLWSIGEDGKITAQSIETQSLTVGGGEASGVTIYDRETGAPKCIYIEGGVIKTSNGGCGTTQNTGSAAIISNDQNPISNQIPNPNDPASAEASAGTQTATTTPQAAGNTQQAAGNTQQTTATTTSPTPTASTTEPILISTTTPEIVIVPIPTPTPATTTPTPPPAPAPAPAPEPAPEPEPVVIPETPTAPSTGSGQATTTPPSEPAPAPEPVTSN